MHLRLSIQWLNLRQCDRYLCTGPCWCPSPHASSEFNSNQHKITENRKGSDLLMNTESNAKVSLMQYCSIENSVSGSQETALMNATIEPRQGLHTTLAADGVNYHCSSKYVAGVVSNLKWFPFHSKLLFCFFLFSNCSKLNNFSQIFIIISRQGYQFYMLFIVTQ